MSSENKTRPYRKKERARQQEETRRRITEAVVELHGSVGPANTTVSEVAERAGVGRMTVYKYFPTEVALFAACSSHWSNQNPMPDFEDCFQIEDFERRIELAIARLYKYYRDNREMLGNIMRDAPSMSALQEVLDVGWNPMLRSLAERLLPPGLKESESKRILVVLSLIIDFRNWEILSNAGPSVKEAARLAAKMVLSVTPEKFLRDVSRS